MQYLAQFGDNASDEDQGPGDQWGTRGLPSARWNAK